MELILIIIVALIVLAGMDADLWPRPLPRARRSEPIVRRPRRAPARASSRRQRPAPSHAGSSRLCAAPRWWWE
jgi:hypothetical protein